MTAQHEPAAEDKRLERQDRLLRLVIRATAAGYLLFWFGALTSPATGAVDRFPAWLYGLAVWGHNEPDYLLMLAVVNVVWALFLWRSADDPARNRLFLDFTLVGNAAHFATMGYMAATMEGELQHLWGDVPFGFLTLAPLAAFWLPARRRTSSQKAG